MIKIVCSSCGRSKSQKIDDGKDIESISHTYCAKCSSTNEDYLSMPIKEILDLNNSDNEDVIEAIGFIKDVIKDEVESCTTWIGDEKKYSDLENQLFDKYLKEVETEVATEAAIELGKIR